MSTCQWFALCDNEAHGTVEHPVLGLVACCDRCARRFNLVVTYPEGLASCDNCGLIDHTEAEEAECIASMVPPPRIEQYAGSWYPLVDGRRVGFGWADPEDALAAYEREVAPCTFLATAFVRRPEARHG